MFWTLCMYCELFWSHCRKKYSTDDVISVIDRTRWWSERGSSNRGPHHCCSDQWRQAVSGDSRKEQDTLLSCLLKNDKWRDELGILGPPSLLLYHVWDLKQCPVMNAAFCYGLMWIALCGLGQPNSLISSSLLCYLQKSSLSSPNSTWCWSKKIKKWLIENIHFNKLVADNKVQEVATITAAVEKPAESLSMQLNPHRFHLLVM